MNSIVLPKFVCELGESFFKHFKFMPNQTHKTDKSCTVALLQ